MYNFSIASLLLANIVLIVSTVELESLAAPEHFLEGFTVYTNHAQVRSTSLTLYDYKAHKSEHDERLRKRTGTYIYTKILVTFSVSKLESRWDGCGLISIISLECQVKNGCQLIKYATFVKLKAYY